MEEKIIIPSITYVGVINEEIYADLVYPAGFGEDTTLTVTITNTSDAVESRIVDDYKNLNADGTLSTSQKTLILDADNTNLKYTININDPARDEVVLELTCEKPNAQVASNVHLNFIGSRILEVLFDEPMKQLGSVFDFGIDASNQNGLLYPYGNDDAINALPMFLGVQNAILVTFVYKIDNKKYAVLPNGIVEATAIDETVNPVTGVVPAYSNFKTSETINNPKTIYITKTKVFTAIKPTNTDNILASGVVLYKKPITESPNQSTVLTNFYFKYFGRDDEGTLYEPVGKPIDWLGYFANHDISLRISPDQRRAEIQFDDYDIPDGDHQLVLNYSKNFTGYTNEARIKDADNNVFPIVSKAVPVEKNAVRAKLIDVVPLSRTKVLLKYDKPVMVIEDTETVHSSLGIVNPITINGVDAITSRYENYYNQLICEIKNPEIYALPVGENIEITVTGTVDRCGYLVDTETFTVPVSDVEPEVIQFVQLQPTIPQSHEKSTLFFVRFNDIMIKPSVPSNNIRFFKIIDGKEIPVTDSIIKVDMPNSAVKSDTMIITVSDPALNPGLNYKVQIDGMTNVIKTLMIPFETVIYLNDLSVPYVTEILLAKENARAVVKYNEMMNITDIHSILISQNYQLVTLGADNLNQCLDTVVKTSLNTDLLDPILGLRDNTWARLIFDNPTPIFTGENNVEPTKFVSHYIKPGYCDLKDVKYVTNISNNVLDFVCPAKHYVVAPFILGNFTTVVKDAQTIILSVLPLVDTKNEIFNAEASEFTITGNAAINNIAAESAVVAADGKSVILTFKADTIIYPNLELNLTPVKTVDVFGNILPELGLNISGYSTPTTAKDFILLDTVGDAAKFLVRYDGNIKVEPGVPSTIASRDYSIEVINGDGVITKGRPALDMQALGDEVTLDFRNLNEYSIEETDSFRIGVTASQLKFNTIEDSPITGDAEIARIFGFTPVTRGYLVRPYLGNDGTNNKFAIYVDDLGSTLNQFTALVSGGTPTNEIPLTFTSGVSSFDNLTTENNIFENFKIELFNADGTVYNGAGLVSKLVYITTPADLINNALAFNIELAATAGTTVTAKISYKLKPTALNSNNKDLATNRVGVVSSENIIVKTI